MKYGLIAVLFSINAIIMAIVSCSSVAGNIGNTDTTSKNIRIGFWNVENLFDTINAAQNDEEFLPMGAKKWTDKKYRSKLSHLASVIYPMHCDILGLAEIENLQVLKDLLNTDTLPKANYQIIHFDSEDERGMDVALLYNPNKLVKLTAESIKIQLGNGDKTRDILYVQFRSRINKDTLHIFVNHWPSRREGKEISEAKRILAANTLYEYINSNHLLEKKVLIIGDFNDNYFNISITTGLHSCKASSKDTCAFQNITALLHSKNSGTLKFGNSWDIFDQILISNKLWNSSGGLNYQRYSVKIYNPVWMQEQHGKNTAAPLRTFKGNQWLNGYSDHFPVLANLVYD